MILSGGLGFKKYCLVKKRFGLQDVCEVNVSEYAMKFNEGTYYLGKASNHSDY